MKYSINQGFSGLPMTKTIDIDRESAVPGIPAAEYRHHKNAYKVIGTTTMREIYEEDLNPDEIALELDDSIYETYDRYPLAVTKGYLPVSENELIRVATRIPVIIGSTLIVLALITAFAFSHRVSTKDLIFQYVNSDQTAATYLDLDAEQG